MIGKNKRKVQEYKTKISTRKGCCLDFIIQQIFAIKLRSRFAAMVNGCWLCACTDHQFGNTCTLSHHHYMYFTCNEWTQTTRWNMAFAASIHECVKYLADVSCVRLEPRTRSRINITRTCEATFLWIRLLAFLIFAHILIDVNIIKFSFFYLFIHLNRQFANFSPSKKRFYSFFYDWLSWAMSTPSEKCIVPSTFHIHHQWTRYISVFARALHV